MKAARILRELVAVPTTVKDANFAFMQVVMEFMAKLDWPILMGPFTYDGEATKVNLLTWSGKVGDPLPDRFEFAFICHTDTVPFSKEWAGALALEERGGMLHGCGACDVKGALACFLEAVTSLRGRTGSVLLVLTGDEEVGCKGMDALLQKELAGVRIGTAIVSEPTSLRPGIAGKGYGLARVTVEGREAHSAFPGKGVSAILVAARLIVQMEEAFARFVQERPEDSLFDPPRTTLNIGVIEGGTAKNIVPGRCSFLVEWRAIPGEAPGAILRLLEETVAETRAAEVDTVITLEGLRDEPGFAPAAEGRLRRQLAELLPGKPTGISFGSEASRLARIADEVIVIGPGDMQTAHSDRECVPIIELERWTLVLRELLQN